MNIALLRVGADSGNLGFHSPLFKDGTFDFIPINETFNENPKNGEKKINESRTFGNTRIKTDKYLIDYFPDKKKEKFKNSLIHYDPEFLTNTYGDPSSNKKGLSKLSKGDYLLFYSSLSQYPKQSDSDTKLYLIGYFEIAFDVTITKNLSDYKKLQENFKNNFHVKHWNIFHRDVTCKKNRGLKLVKGTKNSRLLKKAYLISEKIPYGKDGVARYVVSNDMQKKFGKFNGKIGIQRNALRFVENDYVKKTYDWIKKLE